MEDEKELIRKIRNSREIGMSPVQITRKLQQRGLKLEYIDLLLRKAYPNKAIFAISILIFIVLILSSILVYILFFQTNIKIELQNPLADLKISNQLIQDSNIQETENNLQEIPQQNQYIEIEPEFLSFILNEIGVYDLHKNPFTLEKPVIAFDIEGQDFYSVVTKGEIHTYEGQTPKTIADNPDLIFTSTGQEVTNAILSEDTGEYIAQSIANKNTEIEQIASQQELFAKGYLNIYNPLMST